MVTLFDDLEDSEPEPATVAAIAASEPGEANSEPSGPAEPVTMAEGRLTDSGLANLLEKVERLNKRAKRLGLELIVVDQLGEEWIEAKHPVTRMPYQYRLTTVRVRGIVPRINGWRVLAKIEFTPAGNFVLGFEGVRPEWRTVANRCDHCHKHRTRNDLIAIGHDDGREIVVGRNCLADYIRTGDVEGLIEAAGWLGSIGECFGSDGDSDREFNFYGGGRPAEWPLDTVLKATSLIVRRFGWTPKSAAGFGQASTCETVIEFLLPPSGEGFDRWRKWIEKHDLHFGEVDEREAGLAKDFLAAIPASTTSDYLHNLRLIGALDVVPDGKLGLAVSIVAAARKARDEEIKRREADKAPREFIGQAGKRLRGLAVTVKRMRATEGAYGTTTIITFAHATGQLTWFASGDMSDTWEEDQTYVIDATVKEHKADQRFGNSTIVSRVALSKPAKSKKK